MPYESILELYGGVPFDPRYEHTALHSSLTAQRTYFGTVRKFTLEEYSYLRKERSVKVSFNVETLEEMDISYCGMYNGKKWRYFFITRKEYVSDNVTRLIVELDVLQTYQFDWQIPRCFVEREHVADDTIGANLVEEGLELGDYVSSLNNDISGISNTADWCIMVQASVVLDGEVAFGEHAVGELQHGVFSGYILYTVPADTAGVQRLTSVLNELDTLGKSDAVASMWMYPKMLVYANWDDTPADKRLWKVQGSNRPGMIRGAARTTLDGYTPRNKKLYTYPYSFLYCSNNMGDTAIFKFEYSDGDGIEFKLYPTLTNDAALKIVPLNYRGFAVDAESGLTLTSYPTCAWTQDAYKIWLAQNANQQAFTIQSANVQGALGAGEALLGAGQAIITLGQESESLTSGISRMYSAYQQVHGLMAQRKDKDVQPPQAKGAQSVSANVAMNKHTFTFSDMSVSAYYAKMIDEYFDMYGYRVNRVKTPNITSRNMWNYIKTVGCIVLGDIDAADRRRIGEIFDKGVTFWHSAVQMYRYDLAAQNTIRT